MRAMGADDVGRFVHHDHGRRSRVRIDIPAAVEIHEQMLDWCAGIIGIEESAG